MTRRRLLKFLGLAPIAAPIAAMALPSRFTLRDLRERVMAAQPWRTDNAARIVWLRRSQVGPILVSDDRLMDTSNWEALSPWEKWDVRSRIMARYTYRNSTRA